MRATRQYRNSYDVAGNLAWDPMTGIYYTFDDENRVIKAGTSAGASNVAQYWYDAEGQRIRKVSAAGTEEYVYDPQGHQIAEMQPNGTFNRVELYAGSRHLATYDNVPQQTVFIHNDWQGTERVRSKYDGTSYETCTNLPFGDSQTCTVVGAAADPSPLHYTGKMRDVETNLDYFGARYYSSGMAHWMSPDWADKPTAVPYANFGDPQTLNLYSFVGGNPVTHQDSDGHLMTLGQSHDFSSSHGEGNTGDPDTWGSGPTGGVGETKPAPTPAQDVAPQANANQAAQAAAQQNAPAAHSLTNVVYNETGSLRADPNAKPGQPGSAEDLANGMQAVAEIANRVINAGHPGRVAPDSLTSQGAVDVTKDPHAIDAYGRSQTAADAALAGSNISHGATLYRTRVGSNVTTPLGKSSTNPGETITQHYGPFIEGKHTVVIVVAP